MRKQILAVLLGFVAVVFFAEVGMRVAQAINSRGTRGSSNVDPDFVESDPNVIEIVTLGESTTAEAMVESPTGYRSIDWPHQLEVRLNSRLAALNDPNRVKLTNLGRGASSSPFQIHALKEYYANRQPDAVISMLGVNDSRVVPLESSFFYRHSFVVRFVFWAQIASLCPSCYDTALLAPVSWEPKGLSAADRAVAERGLKILEHFDSKSPQNFEHLKNQIAKLQDENPADQFWMNAAVAMRLFALSQLPETKLHSSEMEAAILKEAEKLLRKSFSQIVVKHGVSLEFLCHVIARQEPRRSCLPDVKAAIAKGASITPSLLTIISNNEVDDADFELIFRSAGFSVSSDGSGEIIKSSYRTLGNFVRTHGMIWFAMQYPTGSTDQFRSFLSFRQPALPFEQGFYYKDSSVEVDAKFRDVIMIGNENFNEIEKSRENEYFADFFARDRGMNFGHTTEKGHARIAENAERVVWSNWPKIMAVVNKRRAGGDK